MGDRGFYFLEKVGKNFWMRLAARFGVGNG